LIEKLDKPAKEQIAKLTSLKLAEKNTSNETLHIWDLMYYHNLLLENEYQLNQDLIKEYFPLEKVTEGLLNVFSKVLGNKNILINSLPLIQE
jgi:Zn-dependent oligopeptidase